MPYLWGTIYMKLTLTIDNTSVIRWWINSSHVMHMDCTGHTGGMMSLGKGAALSHSEKHKLNTKSSTEPKLVGADAMSIKVLWARYFLEAQGYSDEQSIMFQDNQAIVQLEANRSLSSSKCNRHIKVRYFFLKDKIKLGGLFVEYCPTEMMWADVLNKSKQGRPLPLDQSFLMNVSVDYENIAELLQTHNDLLPNSDQTIKIVILSRQRLQAQSRHRHVVLGDDTYHQAGAPRAKTYSGTVRRTN